jgi:hypothetical protein
MAIKKIRHAIFEWFDPDGTRHYAFRGDTVDIPDHVVEAFDKFEPFEDSIPADEGDPDTGDDDGHEGDKVLEAPAKTAPVKAWREYAEWAITNGLVDGLSVEQVTDMDRKELIEALA